MTDVADTLPTDAVMVAVPGATAVTFPFATVAMAFEELVHVIVAPGQLAGVAVAVSAVVSGTEMVALDGLTDTAETHGGTVICAEPCTPFTVALIVVVPCASAATRPAFDTVATV